MEILFREAKFKVFFLFLGIPFVLLGAFGFVFMAVSLGWGFPGSYMCLIFPVVGCIVISFDIKAWARYFRGKRIAENGTDGIAGFISFFRSNYYIMHSYPLRHRHRLNLYGIVFSFTDGRGNTVTQKTPAFLRPDETEALRLLDGFRIRHMNGTAVIIHDLKRAAAELKTEGITELID